MMNLIQQAKLCLKRIEHYHVKNPNCLLYRLVGIVASGKSHVCDVMWRIIGKWGMDIELIEENRPYWTKIHLMNIPYQEKQRKIFYDLVSLSRRCAILGGMDNKARIIVSDYPINRWLFADRSKVDRNEHAMDRVYRLMDSLMSRYYGFNIWVKSKDEYQHYVQRSKKNNALSNLLWPRDNFVRWKIKIKDMLSYYHRSGDWIMIIKNLFK